MKKNRLFIESIVNDNKTLLLGEPGSGKSWFLTNLMEYLKRKGYFVIRHYCFTNTEDSLFDKRVSSDVFFGNLISDIERHFPNIKKEKQQLYASNLKELNLLLLAVNEPIIIIVDGLDHINRVLKTSSILSMEMTRIIDYISKIELPTNVRLILGSQSVDEVDFLTVNHGFKKIKLPDWDVGNTKKLMEKFCLNSISVGDVDLLNLLHEKSEGNPLYLTYILKTLSGLEYFNEEIIEDLPKYDFNLKSYYEYLTSRIFNNTTSEILSCLDFSVSKKELKEIIPMKHHFNNDIKVLSPVITENISRGGIKLYHDSFRRFNIEKLSTIADINEVYAFITKWLCEKGFFESDKSYRYLLSYLNLSEQFDEVIKYADDDFLAKSLYYGHSETLIKNNYKNFLKVADETQNWSLFTYLGELKRAIFTTSSEEHYSQFLENFELYFEAVCSIYGVEKANALLFFNGEKNYSDRYTAKGFRILQQYGYSPQWKEVKGLFENDIALEDFKYYMCYQIQEDNDLTKILNSILSEDYSDYLRVFIVELFNHKGFDVVANYYECIKDDKNENIANKINSALDRVNSEKKYLLKINHII